MLKKINRLKSEDIHLLASFANINMSKLEKGEIDFINEKNLKYKSLLYNTSSEENKNNEFLVSDIIDQLMFDNYDIYINLKQKFDDVNEIVSEIEELDFGSPELEQKFNEGGRIITQYIRLYERLMLESKFDYADIRCVQKQLLENEVQKNIATENYEKCAELQKIINEI